ncbi:retrovirus-related pol polyprotein from transposon TNT 1-94, partial [Tanacetum coccineum]
MAFLSTIASRFPPSNNQLRTSSNPRNKAIIQDGRVTVQQVQGRQTQSYAGTGNRGITTTSKGNYAAGQPRVVKCYNCQGEGHMARQCTQPKRPRNAAWFKEKLMLVEAQKAGQILDEEQLAFLADPGISEAPVAQQIIPHNSAFQTEDLDAYNSDYDDLSSAKAVLMANISSCDSDVLSEVLYSDSYPNDMINQDVQEMQYFEQTHIDDFQDNEIHSDSNIIPYSQYLQESQDAVIQDTNSSTPNDLLVLSLVEQMTDHVAHLDKENQTNKMVNESLTAELERYKERVTIFEQRHNVDLNKCEKLIDSQMDDLIWNKNAKLAVFQQEIDTFKETLSNHVKEKESLSKTLIVFKTESKEKESKYINKEIVLEKQNKEL